MEVLKMNTLIAGIILLIALGFGIYILSLVIRLVNAVEKIASQLSKE
jgi:hypothetical protein